MRKRISSFFAMFFVVASLLMVRISCLGASPMLTQTALKQQTLSLTVASQRGVIFDRNLKRLTNNESEFYAVVSPSPTVIDELGRMGTYFSREKLKELVNENKPFIADIQKTDTSNKNIIVTQSSKRYASSPSAVHTIGYINKDLQGVSGIEKAYDSFLNENKHTISAVCSVDGKGNFLPGHSVEIEAKGSADAGVVLTLDADIQSCVEHATSNIKKGAVVVLDAQDAKIRAMSSFPSYSPTNPAEGIKDEEGAPMINRALSDFAVGSTFKIATAAAALDNGISPKKTYNCTGSIEIDKHVYRCHHRQGHGNLDMEGAFIESCNPYFINLGQEIGGETLKNQAISLGFGREINLCEGISAKAGNLPSTKMSSGQLANFSFGQGDLSANPLQVAESVYAVVAGGKVASPSLVEGTTKDGANINREQNSAPIQAMSEQTANTIKEYMVKTVENTVAQPTMTTAGGKSGTAQAQKYRSDETGKYEAWFAGFFPAQTPKYIAVVLMEAENSGTLDSGAVFAKIADQITSLESFKD